MSAAHRQRRPVPAPARVNRPQPVTPAPLLDAQIQAPVVVIPGGPPRTGPFLATRPHSRVPVITPSTQPADNIDDDGYNLPGMLGTPTQANAQNDDDDGFDLTQLRSPVI